MEEEQTNHSWTINGEKISLETPLTYSYLSNVLTGMDSDTSKISAKLSRLILCKAGEKYDFKSPAMINSGMSPCNFFNIGET
jgi:hypothetical protein